jgi:hypothetical protein
VHPPGTTTRTKGIRFMFNERWIEIVRLLFNPDAIERF